MVLLKKLGELCWALLSLLGNFQYLFGALFGFEYAISGAGSDCHCVSVAVLVLSCLSFSV